MTLIHTNSNGSLNTLTGLGRISKAVVTSRRYALDTCLKCLNATTKPHSEAGGSRPTFKETDGPTSYFKCRLR